MLVVILVLMTTTQSVRSRTHHETQHLHPVSCPRPSTSSQSEQSSSQLPPYSRSKDQQLELFGGFYGSQLQELQEEVRVLSQRTDTNRQTINAVYDKLFKIQSEAVATDGLGRSELDKVSAIITRELIQLSERMDADRMQSVKQWEKMNSIIIELETSLRLKNNQMPTNGSLRWRIKDVMRIFQTQRSTVDVTQLSITSPHFQTPSGHEFRLRAFLNGSGRGKNTHFSLFIQMCRTEFDEILDYPFAGIITFKVMDQSQGRAKTHHEMRFKTSTAACFQKPEGPFCPENGLAQFISHDMLFKNANGSSQTQLPIFVKNDTLFVEASIYQPPETAS